MPKQGTPHFAARGEALADDSLAPLGLSYEEPARLTRAERTLEARLTVMPHLALEGQVGHPEFVPAIDLDFADQAARRERMNRFAADATVLRGVALTIRRALR